MQERTWRFETHKPHNLIDFCTDLASQFNINTINKLQGWKEIFNLLYKVDILLDHNLRS